MSRAPAKAAPRRRVLLAMDSPFAAERRAGVARFAAGAGWILDARLPAFLAQGHHREYLASGHVDGIISMVPKAAGRLREIVLGAGVPIVELWHELPGVPRVLLDQHAIGRAGGGHLLSRGLCSLLFYSHSVDRRVAAVRRDGFFAAARERGCAVAELWWDPDAPPPPRPARIAGSSRQARQPRLEWLAAKLAARPRPLGVMAVNDAVAAEVVDAAALAGLHVPEDVAVLGVDNDPILAQLGPVPLSSVDNARERVGFEAAALLQTLMDGRPAPDGPILIPPAGVVTRRSTEVIAVADPNIRDAARYIHDHFRENIGVQAVVAATYLSRRRLQDLFKSTIGHSMNAEIRRHRLAHAQRLLAETQHKVDQVARLSGFGNGMRLSKFFRRELGTTPQAYRQRHRPTPAG